MKTSFFILLRKLKVDFLEQLVELKSTLVYTEPIL